MPSDEMVEKARKIADDMFFGPHKPECGIPEDQTMTVRYGNAVRVIAAALEAAEAGAVPVAWRWEWNSGGTGKWMTTIGVERPEDHPQRRNITPLYASPPSEASREESRLLDVMGKHTNWELSCSGGWSDDPARWTVHEVTGGRNDRVWTAIGEGETPAEAIATAIRARGER